VKNLSLESIEKKLSESPALISISDVPDKFIGVCVAAEWRNDESGRECLFLQIRAESLGGGIVVQKFTKFHLPALVETLKKLNVDNIVDKKCVWQKTPMRIGLPRWLPIKLVK